MAPTPDNTPVGSGGSAVVEVVLLTLLFGLHSALGVGEHGRARQDAEASGGEACPACVCGTVPPETLRLIGGNASDIERFPWMAALFHRGRFTCGGSLINDRYVLTAAHCVARTDPSGYEVFLRRANIAQEPSEAAIRRRVVRIVVNRYQQLRNNNDVALLLLENPPIRPEDGAVPICLPPAGASDGFLDGREAVVTGWGTTETGELAEDLQQLTVPILTNAQCRRTGYFRFQITAKMLCAGYLEGGRDSCQGDSGGPLQLPRTAGPRRSKARDAEDEDNPPKDQQQQEQMMIVGVVSWGKECAQRNYPGVYARVTRFVSWIRSRSRGACWCD